MRFGIVRILKFILCSLFLQILRTCFPQTSPDMFEKWQRRKKKCSNRHMNDKRPNFILYCSKSQFHPSSLRPWRAFNIHEIKYFPSFYYIYTCYVYAIAYLAYFFLLYCVYTNKHIVVPPVLDMTFAIRKNTRRSFEKKRLTTTNKKTNRKNIWGNLILYFSMFLRYYIKCLYVMSLLVFYLNWPK